MKITLIQVGKTASREVKAICDDYATRINRYTRLSEIVVDAAKAPVEKAKQMEGDAILKKIAPTDFVILLDERGKEYTSVQFAAYLENLFNKSHKNICFVTGGAYGFSKAVYERANAQLCLSKMTFSHQIIRAIFAEQLYRAFTILNNEPYHHS